LIQKIPRKKENAKANLAAVDAGFSSAKRLRHKQIGFLYFLDFIEFRFLFAFPTQPLLNDFLFRFRFRNESAYHYLQGDQIF
jgi:hypothetical protein